MIQVASALANEGFVTFAPCYATFITSRVLDQVRVNLGMMRSPVALVGVSCGCEAAMLGASHMSLEDLAIMRTIPNLEVIAPADSVELASVLRDLAQRPRPAYVRANELDGACLHASGACYAPGAAQHLYVPAGVAPEAAIVSTADKIAAVTDFVEGYSEQRPGVRDVLHIIRDRKKENTEWKTKKK